MKEITVIIPFRNRNPLQVLKAWNSVREHSSVRCRCIVSDYGSREPILIQLRELANQHDFSIVENAGQGLPFNRARVINIGVKLAVTEIVCILDADMILHDNVLGQIADRIEPDEVYFSETRWPQTPRANPERGVINLSFGVFQVLHRRWFEKLHGFTEAIEFWGGEDGDWARRLRDAGAIFRILKAHDFFISHTWHETDNRPENRPRNSEWYTLELEMHSSIRIQPQETWGAPLFRKDRPVLDALEATTDWHVVDLKFKSFIDEFHHIDREIRSHTFVRLELGDRIERRKLSRFRNIVMRLLSPFLDAFSLMVVTRVTGGLESFLVARRVWGPLIKDIHISDDFSVVHIMTNKA